MKRIAVLVFVGVLAACGSGAKVGPTIPPTTAVTMTTLSTDQKTEASRLVVTNWLHTDDNEAIICAAMNRDFTGTRQAALDLFTGPPDAMSDAGALEAWKVLVAEVDC